jgi:hypothetical protein
MFIITTSLSTTGERIGLLQNSTPKTKRNCSNDGIVNVKETNLKLLDLGRILGE